MKFAEIINDDGFRKDFLKQNDFPDLTLYEILHKTREAINKDKLNNGWFIQLGENVYLHNTDTDFEENFSLGINSEIEALAQVLWFIYKESNK